jgi:EmrB/QacA subfamily drug resistance transporter
MTEPASEVAQAGDTETDELAAERHSGGRRMVTFALLLAMMVTAVEQLVVSPAMTTIIAKLKGFDIFPWVISAYLLATTVSTPIYGKLADLFGRKKVLLFGLIVFTVGSVLSGMAQSMGQLIVMRAIQGLGAGAVGPIVMTMLGDLFTLRERAKIQGLFSAVWGTSSIGGPLIGGYLADYLGWRWVFLICIPFAVAAIVMLVYYVSEPSLPRNAKPIDWAGAVLLTAALTSLLWTVLNGSRQTLVVNAVLLTAAAVLFVLFVIREHHASDPILPLDLMTRPVIAASLVGSLCFGGIFFGLDTFVPLFVQGVRGGAATAAGRALMPLFIAWAISVALAARAVVHHGFRRAAVIGSALAALGSLGLVLGACFPEWSRLCFMVGLVIVGTGMGPTSLSFILAVQHSVSWGQRGVATGAATFLRTVGGAVGVGLLGATLSWELAHRLASAGGAGINVVSALRPETHELLSIADLNLVQACLGLTLRDVFVQIVLLGIGSMICAFWLPGKLATQAHSRIDEDETTEDNGLAVVASEM